MSTPAIHNVVEQMHGLAAEAAGKGKRIDLQPGSGGFAEALAEWFGAD